MTTTYRHFILFTTFLFCAVTALPDVMAQYGVGAGATEGLTATGVKKLSLTPQWMEMSIQVEGRSSDLPQASKELKRRISVAKERLAKLKAVDESIIVSKPNLKGEADPSKQRQMKQMMQQYGGGKKGREMLEKTKSVTIVQTITARWKLPGDDDLSKMIASKKLTDEIKAADIASSSDKQPVSAAQEELAEEMSAMMEQYSYGEETAKAGEPTITYIATLSADEYQSAIKSAFADAKTQIDNLAKATGASVQPTKPMMVRLSSGDQSSGYNYGRSAQQPDRKDDGGYELVATSPTEAKCSVSVFAISKHK